MSLDQTAANAEIVSKTLSHAKIINKLIAFINSDPELWNKQITT